MIRGALEKTVLKARGILRDSGAAVGPYPFAGVEWLWTDTTFMPDVSLMQGIPGTDDVVFALNSTGAVGSTIRRATVGEGGLSEVWTYTLASTSCRSLSHNEALGRTVAGGYFAGGRYARSFDSGGVLQFSTGNFGSSWVPDIAQIDELGRIWVGRGSSGTSAFRVYDAAGTAQRFINTTTSDHPTFRRIAALADGSGDVIAATSGSTLIRWNLVGIVETKVWTVANNGPSGTGTSVGSICIANNVAYMGHDLGGGQYVIRGYSVVDGSTVMELPLEPPLVLSSNNEAFCITQDDRGDFWVLATADALTNTQWDVLRYAPDWTLRHNWRVSLDPTNKMITEFTGAGWRPSDIRVTSSGLVFISGPNSESSNFRTVCGRLI